ncbi:MAG: hypothetical protein M3N98_08720 [Actinomycetota bacterium]|nr:hypothetical protein [Actinomycetota bacterium]
MAVRVSAGSSPAWGARATEAANVGSSSNVGLADIVPSAPAAAMEMVDLGRAR